MFCYGGTADVTAVADNFYDGPADLVPVTLFGSLEVAVAHQGHFIIPDGNDPVKNISPVRNPCQHDIPSVNRFLLLQDDAVPVACDKRKHAVSPGPQFHPMSCLEQAGHFGKHTFIRKCDFQLRIWLVCHVLSENKHGFHTAGQSVKTVRGRNP